MTDADRIFQTYAFCEGVWRSPRWIMACYVGPIWVPKRDEEVWARVVRPR